MLKSEPIQFNNNNNNNEKSVENEIVTPKTEPVEVTLINMDDSINNNNNKLNLNNKNNNVVELKPFETTIADDKLNGINDRKPLTGVTLAPPPAAVFRCSDCSKTTNSQRNLQRHRANCKVLASKRSEQWPAATATSGASGGYAEFSFQQQKQQQRFYYQTTHLTQQPTQHPNQQLIVEQPPFSTVGTSTTVAPTAIVNLQQPPQQQQQFTAFGSSGQQQKRPEGYGSVSPPDVDASRKHKKPSEAPTQSSTPFSGPTTSAANSTTDFECEACHKNVRSLRSLKRHRSTCKVLQQSQPRAAETPSQPQRQLSAPVPAVKIQTHAPIAAAAVEGALKFPAGGYVPLPFDQQQQQQTEQQQPVYHHHSTNPGPSHQQQQQQMYVDAQQQQQHEQQQQSSQQKVVDVVESVVNRLRKESTTPQQQQQQTVKSVAQQQLSYDSSAIDVSQQHMQQQQLPYDSQHLQQQQQHNSNKFWPQQQMMMQQQQQQQQKLQMLANEQQRQKQSMEQQRPELLQQQQRQQITFGYTTQQQQLLQQQQIFRQLADAPPPAPAAVAPSEVKSKPVYRFLCPECDKQYSCRKNIKRHRQNVHHVPADEAQDSTSIKKIRLSDEEAAALAATSKSKKRPAAAAAGDEDGDAPTPPPGPTVKIEPPKGPTAVYGNFYGSGYGSSVSGPPLPAVGNTATFSAPPVFEENKMFAFGGPQPHLMPPNVRHDPNSYYGNAQPPYGMTPSGYQRLAAGEPKPFNAPPSVGFTPKYLPQMAQTRGYGNATYLADGTPAMPRAAPIYRHHSFDGAAPPYGAPSYLTGGGMPSQVLPVGGAPVAGPGCSSTPGGSHLADLDYWDQIKSDVDRPFLTRSRADDLEMARIAEDLKRSAEGNEPAPFHDFHAPPYLTSPNFAQHGSVYSQQQQQQQQIQIQQQSKAYYVAQQYQQQQQQQSSQHQQQFQSGSSPSVDSQSQSRSQSRGGVATAAAATTMPVELAEADSTFYDEDVAAAAAAAAGDYSKQTTPSGVKTGQAEQTVRALSTQPLAAVGGVGGGAAFFDCAPTHSPMASPTYGRAPLSAPAYPCAGGSTYFRPATGPHDGAVIGHDHTKMAALSPMYGSYPQQQQQSFQYMLQLRLSQQQQTQLLLQQQEQQQLKQQQQNVVGPAKKKIGTTAAAAETPQLFCGGCAKAVASEYSLKRHRAACSKYKELQLAQQNQQGQQIQQTVGALPTQPQPASFSRNSSNDSAVPDPDSTTFWQSGECASSSSTGVVPTYPGNGGAASSRRASCASVAAASTRSNAGSADLL